MTALATESPPVLVLPIYPLDHAHAALSRALASLVTAQEVWWVSAAAAEYRSELAEVEVRVRRLLVTVDDCRDDWQRARMAAWSAGQL
ncbi:MAG: hypothetical protein ACK4MD_03045 [Demequina sp.]